MTNVSICTVIRNRNEIFRSTIPNWLHFDVFEILVVDFKDDACESVWDIVEPLDDPRIKVIETKHEYRWISAIARNLACEYAMSDKMLMLDVDYTLSQNFFERHDVADYKFISGDAEQDSRSGLIYWTKNQFRTVNGYNENLMYWGHADTDLYNRLSQAGFVQEYADLKCVAHRLHDRNMSFENQIALYRSSDKGVFLHFNRYLCDSMPWTTQSEKIKWSLIQTEHPNKSLAVRNLRKHIQRE